MPTSPENGPRPIINEALLPIKNERHKRVLGCVACIIAQSPDQEAINTIPRISKCLDERPENVHYALSVLAKKAILEREKRSKKELAFTLSEAGQEMIALQTQEDCGGAEESGPALSNYQQREIDCIGCINNRNEDATHDKLRVCTGLKSKTIGNNSILLEDQAYIVVRDKDGNILPKDKRSGKASHLRLTSAGKAQANQEPEWCRQKDIAADLILERLTTKQAEFLHCLECINNKFQEVGMPLEARAEMIVGCDRTSISGMRARDFSQELREQGFMDMSYDATEDASYGLALNEQGKQLMARIPPSEREPSLHCSAIQYLEDPGNLTAEQLQDYQELQKKVSTAPQNWQLRIICRNYVKSEQFGALNSTRLLLRKGLLMQRDIPAEDSSLPLPNATDLKSKRMIVESPLLLSLRQADRNALHYFFGTDVLLHGKEFTIYDIIQDCNLKTEDQLTAHIKELLALFSVRLANKEIYLLRHEAPKKHSL